VPRSTYKTGVALQVIPDHQVTRIAAEISDFGPAVRAYGTHSLCLSHWPRAGVDARNPNQFSLLDAKCTVNEVASITEISAKQHFTTPGCPIA